MKSHPYDVTGPVAPTLETVAVKVTDVARSVDDGEADSVALSTGVGATVMNRVAVTARLSEVLTSRNAV